MLTSQGHFQCHIRPSWRLHAHLQVPRLPHVLPQHAVFHAVEGACSYGRVRGTQTRLPQVAHQPVCVLAVVLAQFSRPAVRPPSSDAICPVQLLLDGIVVKLQVPDHWQNVATKAADALPQQEEAVGHASQLEVLLGVWAADAAVEERQFGCWVVRHHGASQSWKDSGLMQVSPAPCGASLGGFAGRHELGF